MAIELLQPPFGLDCNAVHAELSSRLLT